MRCACQSRTSRMTSRTITSSYQMRKKRTSNAQLDDCTTTGKISNDNSDEGPALVAVTPKRPSDSPVAGPSRRSSKDFDRRLGDASPNVTRGSLGITWNNNSPNHPARETSVPRINPETNDLPSQVQVLVPNDNPVEPLPSLLSVWHRLDEKSKQSASANSESMAPTLPSNKRGGAEAAEPLLVHQMLVDFERDSDNSLDEGATTSSAHPATTPPRANPSTSFSDVFGNGDDDDLFCGVVIPETQETATHNQPLPASTPVLPSPKAHPGSPGQWLSARTPPPAGRAIQSAAVSRVSKPVSLFRADSENGGMLPPTRGGPKTSSVASQQSSSSGLRGSVVTKPPVSSGQEANKRFPVEKKPPVTSQQSSASGLGGGNRPPASTAFKPPVAFGHPPNKQFPLPAVEKKPPVTSQQASASSVSRPSASKPPVPFGSRVTSQQSSGFGLNRPVASKAPASFGHQIRPVASKAPASFGHQMTSQQLSTSGLGVNRPLATIPAALSGRPQDKQLPGTVPAGAAVQKLPPMTSQRPGPPVVGGIARMAATVAPKPAVLSGRQPDKQLPGTVSAGTAVQRPPMVSSQFGASRPAASEAAGSFRQLDRRFMSCPPDWAGQKPLTNAENRTSQPAVSLTTVVNPPIDGSTSATVPKKRFQFKAAKPTSSPASAAHPTGSNQHPPPDVVSVAATITDDSAIWDDIDDSVFQMAHSEEPISGSGSTAPVNSGREPLGVASAAVTDTVADFWPDDEFDSIFMDVDSPNPRSSQSSGGSNLSNGGGEVRVDVTVARTSRAGMTVTAAAVSARPPVPAVVGAKKRPAGSDGWAIGAAQAVPGLQVVRPVAVGGGMNAVRQVVGPAALPSRPAQCSPEEIELKKQLAMEKRRKTMHQSQPIRKF